METRAKILCIVLAKSNKKVLGKKIKGSSKIHISTQKKTTKPNLQELMSVHLDAQNISILHMLEYELQTEPQKALVTCPRSKYKAGVGLFDYDLLSNIDKALMLRELKHFSGIQELHLTNSLFIYTLKNLIPVDVCSHHKATTYFEVIC